MALIAFEFLLICAGLLLACFPPRIAVFGKKHGRVLPGAQPIGKAYSRLAWLAFVVPLTLDVVTRIACGTNGGRNGLPAVPLGFSLACMFLGAGALRLAFAPGSTPLSRDSSPAANRNTALIFGLALAALGVIGFLSFGAGWWSQLARAPR